ncbi:hypothetical protein F4801DRAFT_603834 [Xylaria longipes]|nr:hypothetical protein F4801DRAFT_603834 [Xylaria longipes]
MDQASRINTVLAHPEVFLRPGFNVYLQDAEDQVRRQQRHANPTVPFVVRRSERPLLYTTIENNIHISVIRDILTVYSNFYPTSIDGVWGQPLTTLPPPLIHAVSLGRPEVVSLLLGLGANPQIACGPHNYRTSIPLDATAAPLQSITPIEAALFRGVEIRSHNQEHQDIEECAMILHRAGVPLPDGGANQTVDAALERRLTYPVRAEFYNLVRAILDPLVPLRQGQPSFRTVLYNMLTFAVTYQKSDDVRNTIEYLVGIGSFLVDPSDNQRPYHGNTLAHVASQLGHVKTATFLLEQYTNQGVSLDYDTFEVQRSPNLVNFVQALYRAMSPGGFQQGKALSGKDLHESLLYKLIRSKDDASSQWLVEQKVGTMMHVHFALIMNNYAALQALIRLGLPLNTPTSITVEDAMRYGLWGTMTVTGMTLAGTLAETPLNLALRLERYEMACFLIHHGADASLVFDKVKQALSRNFPGRFSTTYVKGREKITPDMLRPEYFATYDWDRSFAMFYYVLG